MDWEGCNDDDHDNKNYDADDINKDNKEKEEDNEKYFFQKYQLSYPFGTKNSARFEWWWR